MLRYALRPLAPQNAQAQQARAQQQQRGRLGNATGREVSLNRRVTFGASRAGIGSDERCGRIDSEDVRAEAWAAQLISIDRSQSCRGPGDAEAGIIGEDITTGRVTYKLPRGVAGTRVGYYQVERESVEERARQLSLCTTRRACNYHVSEIDVGP